MVEQTIPVVDMRDWLSGDEAQKAAFAKTVGDALKDIGFFAVEHHGIDLDVIRKSYGLAEQFFELPDATKRKYEDPSIGGQRGFTSFGREHAKDSPAPDLKEFWHVGRDTENDAEAKERYLDNVWPDDSDVPGFRPSFETLYTQIEDCGLSLLEACSVYIDEDPSFFRDMAKGGNSILRVIHYPPVADDANPASVRAGAHEDINFITLLCEATAGGLELLQRDGSWLPIHALDGQIIVDSGDMIQQLTNGLFRATTHRVVNPDNSRDRRFSMPFFMHPRPEVDLSPMDKCVAMTGGERKFPNITADEYLKQRLEEIGLNDPVKKD